MERLGLKSSPEQEFVLIFLPILCAHSHLIYNEFTDHPLSVGRLDGEGEDWPPGRKMKSLRLHLLSDTV